MCLKNVLDKHEAKAILMCIKCAEINLYTGLQSTAVISTLPLATSRTITSRRVRHPRPRCLRHPRRGFRRCRRLGRLEEKPR